MTTAGSAMDQPFAVIALVNEGPTCTMDGYPGLGATGESGFNRTGPGAPLAVSVRRGSDYERPDPGPSLLTLPKGASASFAVGTTTNYPDQETITGLAITPPNAYTQVPLPATLATSSPSGTPIVLIVTAVVSGSAGPPQPGG